MSSHEPQPADHTVAREDLREAALSGVRWVAVARVGAEVAAFLSTIALARLIAPSEFGIVAIAMFFHALAAQQAGIGFASALVQRKTINRKHRESATAVSLVVGVALSTVVFLAAPLASPLFGERAIDAIRLISPAFAIMALSAPSTALLQRRIDFRSLTVFELVSTAVGVATSVALAFAGFEAEAMLIGTLIRSVAQTTMVLWKVPPARPRWHRTEGRDLAGFGIHAALGSLGYLGFRNIDYAIVGATLGMTALGFYWRAYNLSFEYQHKAGALTQRLAFPVFSRARDLADMRAMRFRVMRVNSCLMFPFVFFVMVSAPQLVPLVYGEAWTPAVAPVQILAVAALAVPLLMGSGGLLLAAGRARELMYVSWGAAISYAIVIALVAPLGLTAVCVAVAGYQGAKFVVIQHLLLRRTIGIKWAEVLQEVGPALVSSLALLTAGTMVREVTLGAGAPAAMTLALTFLAGTLAYVLTLRLAFAGPWRDLMVLVRRTVGGSARLRAGIAAFHLTRRAATGSQP